jgi:hypothetical protein
MESDLAAVSGLKAQVLVRVQELTTPAEETGSRVERVRLAEFFTEPLDSEESVNEALERLREHLHKLIAQGIRIVLE